jgi:hypothetical protein
MLFAIKVTNFILKTKFNIEAIPIKPKNPRAKNEAGT